MGWTLQFKSLDNVTCTVDIDGGGTSATLTGAAKPVEYEEDDSNDLLRVIRAKTGYIHLMERTAGELSDIYPTLNAQRTVEIKRGNELLFYGYLQAQDFDKEWLPLPRKVSLPIVSPLGVMGETYLNPIATAGNTTIGTIMKQVCQHFGYSYVIFPATLLQNYVNPMHVYVNNRIFSPYNEDFNFGVDDETVFSPISYTEFIEAFCHFYGLIVHDNVFSSSKCLTFTRFDYTGSYVVMTVSALDNTSYDGTQISPQSLDFATLFSMADDNGKESTVLPIGKLEIDHGEYLREQPMNLRLCTNNGSGDVGSLYNVGKVMYLTPLSILVGGEFASTLWNNSHAYYTDQPSQGNMTRIAGAGSEEVIDLSYNGSFDPPSDVPFFEYTFSKFPRTGFYIVWKTKEHQFNYRVQVQSGSKYLAKSGSSFVWTTTPTIFGPISANDDGDYLVKPENDWSQSGIPATTDPITMRLYQTGAYATYWGDPITELKLATIEDPLAEYYTTRTNPVRTIKVAGSDETANISLLFHDYIDNPGRIIGGHVVAQNQYSYLFQALHVLDVAVTRNYVYDLNTMMYSTFTINNVSGWKILAIGGELRDDVFYVRFIRT